MEYLVLECHPAYAVLLDEAGRVVRGANLGYEVGQRVTEVLLMEEDAPKTQRTAPAGRMVRRAVGVLAACLCLVLLVGGLFLRTAHARVELYLGPAASLEVDRDGTVVAVTALNPEGETLLSGYEGAGKSAETVCRELMELVQREDFAPPEGGYSLTVSAPGASWTHSLESRLWQQMAAYGDTTLLVLPVTGSKGE